MCFLLTACDRDAAPTPPRGPEPAPPRIIALGTELCGVLVELGLAPRIVGADSPCLAIPALARAVDLGPGDALSAEGALALRPDFILALARETDPMARFAASLASETVRSRVFAPRDANEALAVIHQLGELFGRELRAAVIASRYTREVSAVATRRDAERRLTVAWVLERDPTVVVGATGALHELLELAGGENAYHDPSGDRLTTTWDELLARGPDVVLGVDPSFAGVARGVAIDPSLVALPILDLPARVRALHALLYRPDPPE